jgi:hypothetical protein
MIPFIVIGEVIFETGNYQIWPTEILHEAFGASVNCALKISIKYLNDSYPWAHYLANRHQQFGRGYHHWSGQEATNKSSP